MHAVECSGHEMTAQTKFCNIPLLWAEFGCGVGRWLDTVLTLILYLRELCLHSGGLVTCQVGRLQSGAALYMH